MKSRTFLFVFLATALAGAIIYYSYSFLIEEPLYYMPHHMWRYQSIGFIIASVFAGMTLLFVLLILPWRTSSVNQAKSILKKRLASGVISEDEYNLILKTINRK